MAQKPALTRLELTRLATEAGRKARQVKTKMKIKVINKTPNEYKLKVKVN